MKAMDVVTKEEGIERLKVLYAMFEGIPARRVDMNLWNAGVSTEPECGTGACLLGWAATYPPFQELGLEPMSKINPSFPKFQGVLGMDAGERFFGISWTESADLFQGIGGGPLHQKRTALQRIRELLLRKGAITKQRASELEMDAENLTQ